MTRRDAVSHYEWSGAICVEQPNARRNVHSVKPYISNYECSDIAVNFTIPVLPPRYEVNIDFDDAHRAWVANKRAMPNSCYKYRCIAITKTGKHCFRSVLKQSDYCGIHQNQQLAPTTYVEIVELSETAGCCRQSFSPK